MWESQKQKSLQLGMSFGKAGAILRKNLLFILATKCNLDFCFRCGNQIKDLNDFTIDHKISWLYSANPSNLFFDVNNVAFSHASCNLGARNRPSTAKSKSGFLGVT